MLQKISILLVYAVLSGFATTPYRADEGYVVEVTIENIILYTEEIGALYNICPELLQSIIEAESNYDPTATNGNCIGLMQISKKWHTDRMERLGVTDLYDPYSNILVGADYLSELWEIAAKRGYGDDLYYVLMRYNMKTSTANKMYENGEISSYAIAIAERSAELEEEHGK